MTPMLFLLLAIAALVLAIATAAGARIPLWVSVLILAIIEILEHLSNTIR